jgi:hypothetical protein
MAPAAALTHDMQVNPDQPAGIDDYYDRLATDSADLVAIGAVLGTQDPSYPASIPQALADRAVQAWHREDSGEPAEHETPQQQQLRAHAGTLALIGFAIDESGYLVGKHISVTLSPDLVSDAVTAADAAP